MDMFGMTSVSPELIQNGGLAGAVIAGCFFIIRSMMTNFQKSLEQIGNRHDERLKMITETFNATILRMDNKTDQLDKRLDAIEQTLIKIDSNVKIALSTQAIAYNNLKGDA